MTYQFSSGIQRILAAVLSTVLLMTSGCTQQPVTEASDPASEMEEPAVLSQAEQILAEMSLDEKISQMIIPAMRTWNEENVTDLSNVSELAEALRKHQYGGIILYGANIKTTPQTAKLVLELQKNNLQYETSGTHVPYFMPIDEEGGVVTRLTSGTRMTGSMAVGATGEHAEANAEETGKIIGEELASLGFNIDYAPVIDVNNNAANPVIGVRSFSDDPELVARLGIAFAKGLSESNVIATYKHFPGHGDTGVDSHIGTPSVEKTYDEIKAMELVPFQEAVKDGAELIMTAHITYPLIDEEVTFGDGVTTGYYPATMSEKMIKGILREDMGFDGVVAADALEMDAIRTAGLVPGEVDSLEYAVNVAEKVILADVDMLLLPRDMKDAEAVEFYDGYISGIAEKVESGEIPLETIDNSVLRILKLKEKYGILNSDYIPADEESWIKNATAVVGSTEHHMAEKQIAEQAITIVRNEAETLPVSAETHKIVILGRNQEDRMTLRFAMNEMKQAGEIPTTDNVTVDYYYAPSEDNPIRYTDEVKQAIAEADIVIVLSKIFSIGTLADGKPLYEGVHQVIEDTHASGGKCIVLSDNLPYDSARFQDADAIVLAYMGSGLDMDPSAREDESANMIAFNANVVAALRVIFGVHEAEGILPVNIPELTATEDGDLVPSDSVMYERGFGLKLN